MMTHDQMIAVIQAHKEGKTVQARLRGRWVDLECPSWNFNANDYRVKPEPPKPVAAKTNGVAVKQAFDTLRGILKQRSKGEVETWGFVAAFMEMIDEAEKLHLSENAPGEVLEVPSTEQPQ